MAAATTVFGLFKTRAEAEAAVRALEERGFGADQVGMLGPGDEHDEKYGRNLAASIGGGTAAGAVAGGVLLGLGAGVIPGAGLVIAGGTLLPILVGVVTGASAGGVAGGLLGLAGSSDRALFYDQQVQAGSYLVSVTGGDPVLAEDVLTSQGAFDAAPIETPPESESA